MVGLLVLLAVLAGLLSWAVIPSKEHHLRPPEELSVLLQDGSHGPAACAASPPPDSCGVAAYYANVLRALGYVIAGIDVVSRRRPTTVSCRDGFEQEARLIARILGPRIRASLVPFPGAQPRVYGKRVHFTIDCIVTFGTGYLHK